MGGGDHEFLAPGQLMSEPASQRLTNEDFRKLMMTPRSGSGSSTPATPATQRQEPKSAREGESDRAAQRRKKKSYYAKLKKDEDDKMAELAQKYRDRAKERRDGQGDLPAGGADPSAAAYRAVAPDARQNHDAAERRRQLIQESKYLGGDMEHTHLVKGLDFALLQKVRSEIHNREAEVEVEVDDKEKGGEEEEEGGKRKEEKKAKEEKKPAAEDTDIKIECRTVLAKNVVRGVFRPDVPKINELFLAGRMAYVIDLEEEAESDIPTTLIRSKKDIVQSEQKATLSTNDIVINKLTQILSYLRAGSRSKKKKKDKLLAAAGHDALELPGLVKGEDMPIYDDVGDYRPIKSEDRRDEKRYRDKRDRDRDRDRDRRDRDRRDRDRDRRDRDRGHGSSSRWEEGGREKRSYFDKPADEEREHAGGFSHEDKQLIKTLIKKEDQKTKEKEDKKLDKMMGASNNEYVYAECYPGFMEMNDALGDSDDEADFSKMDMGNKKGPVGRWDFETQEEYSDYMSKKEALPKAAFQYGMKMSDGRKTRGKIGHTQKSEKAKLDKEWNQISALIDKRKSGGPASKKQKLD